LFAQTTASGANFVMPAIGSSWPVVRLRDPARELTFAASALPANLRFGRRGLISATGHERTIAVTAVHGGRAFLRKFGRVGNGN